MLTLEYPNRYPLFASDLVDDLGLPVAADQDSWHLRDVLTGPQNLGRRMVRWAVLHERQARRDPGSVAEAFEAGTLTVNACVVRAEGGVAAAKSGNMPFDDAKLVGHLQTTESGVLVAGAVGEEFMRGIRFQQRPHHRVLRYPNGILVPVEPGGDLRVGSAPDPLPHLADLEDPDRIDDRYRDLWAAAARLDRVEAEAERLLANPFSDLGEAAPPHLMVQVDVSLQR